MLSHALPIYSILFFVFAAMLVAVSLLVVFVRKTVQSALWLIVAFILSSVLWMMMQAEFLALALIFVYVGAVLTLFLFVIMMINTDDESEHKPVRKALPWALMLMALFVAAMWMIFHQGGVFHDSNRIIAKTTTYNNTLQMGTLLYTRYVFAFELAGAVLLVAIIGAIVLAFFGRPKGHARVQTDQRDASKANGLRVVDLPRGRAS